MEKDFRTRLKEAIKVKDISYKDLGDRLDITEQQIKNYVSGRSGVPMDKFIALSKELDINPIWLLKGEEAEKLVGNQYAEPENTYRKAKAGRSLASHNRVQLRNLVSSIVDDLPDAAYDIFEVEGSSMETTLSAGDKLICRMESIETMVDNRIYVLVTNDPVITGYNSSGVWIKRCNHRKDNGYISCRSDNKETTEPYPTFRFKVESIKEVWYPVMKVTAHLSDPNRDIYNRIDELESRIEMLELDQDR